MSDQGNRTLTGLTFTATLAGAIHYPTHPTRTCPLHGELLLHTQVGRGRMLCCRRYKCTYWEHLDVQLSVRVKSKKKTR